MRQINDLVTTASSCSIGALYTLAVELSYAELAICTVGVTLLDA